MLKIRDFMSSKLVSVSPNSKIVSIANIMKKKKISSVIVEDKNKPIGVITERDLVKEVVAGKKCSTKCKAKDIMTPQLITIDADKDISEAAALMSKKNIRRLLVEEDKKIVGIITETDIIKSAANLTYEIVKEDNKKTFNENFKKVETIKNIYHKISTGSKDLDIILEGGFPLGSNILVEGAPGSGKSLLAYNYIYQGLKEGNTCILIFANQTLDELKSGFSALGFNIEEYLKKGLLKLVFMMGKEIRKIKGVEVCKFDDLSSLSSTIERLADNKKNVRCVISVLSSALIFWDPKTIYRYLFDLTEDIKEKGVTSLYIIESDMHDKRDITAIEQLMDGVLEFGTKEKEEEIETYLSVKKMKGGDIISQKRYVVYFNKNTGLTVTEKKRFMRY